MTPKPFLSKEDTNDEDHFYEIPRHVTHIDDNACERLKNYYRSLLIDGDAILDLMSSFVSNLPDEIEYSRVSAQGMNRVELEANLQLTDFVP